MIITRSTYVGPKVLTWSLSVLTGSWYIDEKS